MTVPRCLMFMLGVSMTASSAYAQAVFAPRATALASYGAVVRDTRGFTADPAGIVEMRDWDFTLATYRELKGSGGNFVFGGFGLGKRLFDNQAVALQYAPGVALEVIEPATLSVIGVNIPADRTISYSEPFGSAYAYRVSEAFSLGVQGRMQSEKITDPQYSFQRQDTSLVALQQEFAATVWFIDLGLQWKAADDLTLAALGRGLVRFRSGEFPEEFSRYELPLTRDVGASVAWRALPALNLVAEATTSGTGALGVEWNPLSSVALRGGLYASTHETPFVFAYGAGIGWSFALFEIDAAYLGFARQDNRQGVVQTNSFDASGLTNLALSPLSSDRFCLSVKGMLGNVRESLARIEGVEMLGGIYPSSYQALAYKPLGRVRVRNISGKPIQARASFYVERFMDQPTETQQVYIPPGEVAEIPFMAVFNEHVKSVSTMTIREGTVSVSATVAEEYDDRTQTRVLIHGRNAWDGNVLSLRYFVTPDDPEVIRMSRDILVARKDSLERGPQELRAYRNARALCEAFAGRLMYVSDPKQNDDYVQYPSETLTIRGGDCDDMAVAFASLLSSVGIATAFVDVVPPAQPEKSHVFLLFDTGIDPRYGAHVSSNPKRYMVRKSKSGEETIWLPLETTVIARGFEEAWTAGAQEYFDDVEIGLGLVKGWVRIVDVN